MSSYAQSVSTPAPVTPVRLRSSVDKASPRTPSSTASTPYTLSSGGRSYASSLLTTPSSVKSCPTPLRRTKSNKSVADLTQNWRTRAQLNGIKVSANEDEGSNKGARIVSLVICLYSHFPTTFPPEGTAPFLLSPVFSSGLRCESLKSSSPDSVSKRASSVFNTPSPKAHNGKYTLGAFSTSRCSPAHDSPLFDTSEDHEHNDPSTSTFPSFQVLQDRSNSNCPQTPRSACSVCNKESTASSRMIVLSPCSHIFCASCFTGTLNIVGEKNMSCMECYSPVDNFHFTLAPQGVSLLGTAFEECVPTVSRSVSVSRSSCDTVAVLRIDNVPWDVTPPAIQKFIKHPILRAHVLLDVKGKTLSHAFVQLALDNARAVLRSSQNAILGQGRRARAVTVTLSSEIELMAALYPQWRGNFDGYQPSLDGLDNEKVNGALQHGLISKTELDSLLNLITNPDSHFLKVPSLPFYSLVSILSTFPSDVDSRVFWSGQLRDALFRVTHAALQLLAKRKKSKEDADLWDELLAVSINCRAFTGSQIFQLQLVDNTLAPDSNLPSNMEASPLNLDAFGKLDTLAEQFGLEPGVLAAIIQSLA